RHLRRKTRSACLSREPSRRSRGQSAAAKKVSSAQEISQARPLGGSGNRAPPAGRDYRSIRLRFAETDAIDIKRHGKKYRSASFRKFERRQSERVLCRGHPGRDSDPLI